MNDKKLTPVDVKELLITLQQRFEAHRDRHPHLNWEDVADRLQRNPDKLWSLHQMAQTGGEPDLIGQDEDRYVFCDCSTESPSGRRSLCYDDTALEARKKNKPSGSATALAEHIGIQILNEDMYRHLQTLGNFDLKSSSWIETPDVIRQKGGALYCDRRYDHVFVYHNGADSYYAARGFRGILYV